MKRITESYRCPEGYVLLDTRREIDGQMFEEFSCARKADIFSSSMRMHWNPQPEAKTLRSQYYECPEGFSAMGTHRQDIGGEHEGFEFSCVKYGEEKHLS